MGPRGHCKDVGFCSVIGSQWTLSGGEGHDLTLVVDKMTLVAVLRIDGVGGGGGHERRRGKQSGHYCSNPGARWWWLGQDGQR